MIRYKSKVQLPHCKMVLTKSVFEADYPVGLTRKIKIRQQQQPLAEAPPPSRSCRSGRCSSRMDDVVARHNLASGTRVPAQPKLRKIAVASDGGDRSRRRSQSRGVLTAEAAALGSHQQQQQQQQQSSGSGAASNASAASRGRGARAASPVLSQSSRRGCRSHTEAPPGQPKPPPRAGASVQVKRSSSFLAGFDGRGLCSLLTRRRRNRADSPPPLVSGRKSVSFSADTNFVDRTEAAPRLGRPTSLHESKLYRKGVLQDTRARLPPGEESANLPLSWEESLGGPRALLGAAQDADDELIKKIVSLANKAGLGNIDLNAIDNTGRTAISYMAGNGSALMLEACLSFPGVDANLPDNEGNTPLHFAAQAGQTECLNILLQRCPNIEVDARNSLGFTALMKAALQGRTKCAKILLFAGANPTLRDHGRGLRAEQWARFCGRYVCAEVIERFARHRLLEKTTSCRWGSEPELAAQLFQGKLMGMPSVPLAQQQQPHPQPSSPSGLKSKIRRVFRTSSNSSEKSFSLVSQLTSAALCASSPVLPKPSDVSPVVKSLLRPLSVPQLRITLVAPQDIVEKTSDKCAHSTSYGEKIETSMVKPPRTKKKSK